MSNSKQLPYYFNPQTTESRWEPPDEADMDKLKTYMAQHFTQQKSGSGAAQQNGAGGRGGGDKIQCAHLLVKHAGSRRPSSWREARITRSKEEAEEIIRGHQQRIQGGEATLMDLAVTESDCGSARKRGDLYGFLSLCLLRESGRVIVAS